jgi:hypothetical protein
MIRIFPRFDGRGRQMRAPTLDKSHEANRNGEDGVELAGFRSCHVAKSLSAASVPLPLPACPAQ